MLTRPFLFYAAATLLFAWLACGPSERQWSAASLWHAYDWIAWIPGFSGLRVPARFFMLASLCLAVAAGLAVAAAAVTPRSASTIAVVICAIAVVDGWIVAMPLGVPPRPFGTKPLAGAHVVELPVDDGAVNVAAMYREMAHRLPVVNGYAGYVPPHMDIIEWALRRKDPSVFTELRRGHPLYVVVSNTDASTEWAAFMDAQNQAQLLEISGAGRLYLLPASGFAPQVTVGSPLPVAHSESRDGWLIFDLGAVRAVRAVEVRSRGHMTLFRATVKVETSNDGATWAPAADEAPGGPALVGALRDPLAIPLRVFVPDPSARYVRLNAGSFPASAVTLYGP